MDFKEFLINEMEWEEFLRLQDELPKVAMSIFGKKNVKVYPTGDIQFQMGTRWGSMKLSKGSKVRFQADAPQISIMFQWDKSGKKGPTPPEGVYQANTPWEGSFALARALKQVVRWAGQNGIGIAYGAEPDRAQAYGRVLTAMGFQNEPGKKQFFPGQPPTATPQL